MADLTSTKRPLGRYLIWLFGAVSLALLLAWSAGWPVFGPLPVKVYRLGYLGPQSAAVSPWIANAIREQLREDGFVEGQNLIIDWRWAEGVPERLPAMAAELVKLKPDVLFVSGEPTYVIVRPLAGTIPIVAFFCADPLRQGFVASLARPGDNLTGASLDCAGSQLRAKQMGLLKAAVPGATDLAVLWYTGSADRDPQMAELEAGAKVLGLRVQSFQVRSSDDFETTLATAGARADSLLLLADAFLTFHRVRLADLAIKHRLPSVYTGGGSWAAAGGLLDYGANLTQMNRRAASKVAKIFRGEKPGDLPFENATNFDFIINLKTAQALGLTIPQSVLVQATQVIQ